MAGGGLAASMCTKSAYDRVMRTTKSGYKQEALILRMLNCMCKSGEFRPVNSIDALPAKLEAISKAAMTESGYLTPSMRKNDICDSGMIATNAGAHLSLDGYNEELNIAYEYNGPGHYRRTTPIRSCEDAVTAMSEVDKDIVKEKLLLDAGIPLIRLHFGIPMDQWEDYVMSRLLDLNALRRDARKSDGRKMTYIAEIPEPPLKKMDDITSLYEMVDDMDAQNRYIARANRWVERLRYVNGRYVAY